MRRLCPLFLTLFIAASALAQSTAPTTAGSSQTLLNRIAPSLVAVQFNYEFEIGKRELVGAGIVVSDDGLVMCPLNLTPTSVPDEQLKDFKIIVPGADMGEDLELDATFLGRDERTSLMFVRAKQSHAWKPLKFVAAPIAVGDRVTSIGLLPKVAGYKPYYLSAIVASTLNGPVPQVFVGAGGLCSVGSPVFNEQGDAIGFINSQPDQSILLNDPRNPNGSMMDASRLLTPAGDFLQSLQDPPTESNPITLGYMGVAQLSGIEKNVAEYFKLKGQPAVQIGDVLPGKPADKAGIKDQDIVVKVNGQPLERGDTPEETARIFARKLLRMKVGDTVKLSVLVDRDQPLKDVTVTLEPRPEGRNKAKRYFSEDLGFTVRQLVFEDTYERRLPADSPGVIIAFIKPNSSASTARLQSEDMITQMNATPVTSLEQFKTDYEAFRKQKPHDAVVLEVMRGSNTQVIRVEPPQ